MAWILSTAPDASVRDGTLALKLTQPLADLQTHDRPLFLRSLAAAHAEASQFTQAAQVVRQALKELSSSHPLQEPLRNDLRRYEAGEPVRISAVAE